MIATFYIRTPLKLDKIFDADVPDGVPYWKVPQAMPLQAFASGEIPPETVIARPLHFDRFPCELAGQCFPHIFVCDIQKYLPRQ